MATPTISALASDNPPSIGNIIVTTAYDFDTPLSAALLKERDRWSPEPLSPEPTHAEILSEIAWFEKLVAWIRDTCTYYDLPTQKIAVDDAPIFVEQPATVVEEGGASASSASAGPDEPGTSSATWRGTTPGTRPTSRAT